MEKDAPTLGEAVRGVELEADRRRNILELTDTGHELFKKAEAASLHAERSFTATLNASKADELRRLLRTVL